ncbi:MAG: hypothetical protein V4633_03665 [Pseudomonadota bacterium]
MKTNFAVAVAVLALTGCATSQQDKVGDIAATPLRDFNLSSKEIPPVLLEARKQPYLLPADQSCAALLVRVRELDAVLGPDLDDTVVTENGHMVKVGNAVGHALQKTVEGAIPFRGWVRKLSGAERHANDIAASIGAGTARRAFLKGVAVARTCQVQAVAGGPETVYK